MATSIVTTYDNTRAAVLSMDVGSADEENLYRIRFGDTIKYISVDGGVYNHDTLEFPPYLFEQLPALPVGNWTTARIFREREEQASREHEAPPLRYELLFTPLKGVASINVWHSSMVDVNDLEEVGFMSARVRVVRYGEQRVTAIAKIARFDFEIPWVEQETAAYRRLDCQGVAPKFLCHLTEHGRVMGFLMEKLEGRSAHIDDLETCQNLVRKVHALGILHGDLNRHNFVISKSGAKILDFEHATLGDGSLLATEMDTEFVQLVKNLQEDTGLGEKLLLMYEDI